MSKMNYRGVIFDIDGVLEWHGKVCPGAPETMAELRRHGIAVRFLTNSSLKSRASCAARLIADGIEASPDEVVTASSAAASFLRTRNPRSIWLTQAGEGRTEFADFTIDNENPEYVLIGEDPEGFNYDTMNRAFQFLMNGSRLIGMQPELVDACSGDPVLNTGSWVGMLERAARQEAIYIGKPNPFAFNLALETLHLDRSAVLMVGDRVDTDILGANRAGLDSVLLRTGEFDPFFLEQELAVPTYQVNGITDLLSVLRINGKQPA